MYTKLLRQKQHRLTPPPPEDRNAIPLDRKLPPLPIGKRKLPSLPVALPQSKSHFARRNKCVEESNGKTVLSPRIIITPPRDGAFRALFSNIHKKIVVSKTSEHETAPIHTKSKWRPTLQFIMRDAELLNILIAFMTKRYNEENILFLQSVNRLSDHIHALLITNSEPNMVQKDEIHIEIASIYDTYVVNNAQKQINLSGECFNEILYIRQHYKGFPLTKTALIFERSSKEIIHLIQTSILSGFYSSNGFQCIANERHKYTNDGQRNEIRVSDENDGYDSDDVEYGAGETSQAGVHFDCHSVNKMNKWTEHNQWMISSNGFAPESGIHEWEIKLLKGASTRMEFGVVSAFDKSMIVNEFGICDTSLFGARAVYGYNHMNPTFYYASYNQDNTVRVQKDLSSLPLHESNQWREGDVIKICLNQSKWCMKFYLNGNQVRKTISVEKHRTYYPIILYRGTCKFQVSG